MHIVNICNCAFDKLELFVNSEWPNFRSLQALEKNEMNRILRKYQRVLQIMKNVVWRNFNFLDICVICIHISGYNVQYLIGGYDLKS